MSPHRSCPRTFTLLAAGGVRVEYQCGSVVEFPHETAVDFDVLQNRLTRAHHHWVHVPEVRP